MLFAPSSSVSKVIFPWLLQKHKIILSLFLYNVKIFNVHLNFYTKKRGWKTCVNGSPVCKCTIKIFLGNRGGGRGGG